MYDTRMRYASAVIVRNVNDNSVVDSRSRK